MVFPCHLFFEFGRVVCLLFSFFSFSYGVPRAVLTHSQRQQKNTGTTAQVHRPCGVFVLWTTLTACLSFLTLILGQFLQHPTTEFVWYFINTGMYSECTLTVILQKSLK